MEEVLFFKKKKNSEEAEKVWYCVGIITKGEVNEGKHDRIADKISNAVDNVGILAGFVQEEMDSSKLQILYRRFFQPDFSVPCIIINEINHDEIKRETELLEKEHKWKKFLGLLSFADYQEAENRAIYDFNKTLYLTEDVDKAIEFLRKQAAK